MTTDDEVKDVIHQAAATLGFRLATDEEVQTLLEEGKEEREKQRANMDRPEYNDELKVTKTGWYEKARKQTLKTLSGFLSELAKYPHDYNSIVYAVAAAGIGAAWAMDKSPNGGITGFQSGAVFWEFFGQWMQEDGKPARLVQYKNMLYPQYEHSFEKTISPATMKWLREEAAKKLSESSELSHSEVTKHWRSIVAGNPPFGYTIDKELR